MIITIDGTAGTGKSTVAKKLAQTLSFLYFDTGAMYRSFCWYILDKKIDIADEEKVKEALLNFSFNIVNKDHKKVYFVNKKDVTDEIRTPLVTSAVSKISAYEFVRKELVKIQRKFGKLKNAVFEGRDMGTVVFPNADLKIFLKADPEVRAERRYKEYISKFPEQEDKISLNKILEEIQYRDHYDSTRKISPLKKASDAFAIDTTKMNVDEVVNEILLLKKEISERKRNFFYLFIRFIAKSVLKIFFRLEVVGVENVPKGAAIIASNHVSFLDPPVVAAACPFEINFLARSSLFKKKFFSWLIKKLNAHPISPSVNDRKTFKVTFELLNKSQKILIFPEGERSKSGDISEIKSGLGFLAWKSKAPIVPTFIGGTFQAWPKSKKFPRLFKKVVCVFGKPIYVQDFENLSRTNVIEQTTKRTFDDLVSLKKKYQKIK